MMNRSLIRMLSLLLLMQLTGFHSLVASAGPTSERESVIVWHYPHARLYVDCRLPAGTVVSSVAISQPERIPVGISILSTTTRQKLDWVMLDSSLPGFRVRAALDSNGGPRNDGAGMLTLLRLELLKEDRVSSGWLTVPPQPLWWEVFDPTTRARLWRARIVWKGRMKVETEDSDEPYSGKGCS